MRCLSAQVKGRWHYLYLILDLFSRKIVSWEVHAADDATHLVRCTVLAEDVHGRLAARSCAATTAPPSKPPPCWSCSTGRTSTVLFPATRLRRQPLRNPALHRKNSGPGSRSAALPTSNRGARGAETLCNGTTSSIATAASATSAPHSATPVKIRQSWSHCTTFTSSPRAASDTYLYRYRQRAFCPGCDHGLGCAAMSVYKVYSCP